MNAILKSLFAVLVASIFTSFSAHAYDLAQIINKTPFYATGQISYPGCRGDSFSVAPGTTWTASSRGACLITSITASLNVNGVTTAAQTYESSGTSYGTFYITPTQTNFRVWSSHEWQAEVGDVGGKSPGFYIVNKTDFPYSLALSQAGCLYYGVVQPGEVWRRSTGAVWFSLTAGISLDGKETRTDWDCVKPVAAIVGAVAIAAITGGYGAFAALPTVGATTAAGASGLTALATSNTVLIATGALGAATKAGLVAAASLSAKELGEALTKNGKTDLKGQYAGPEWPFRCAQMPVYHLAGGPSLKIVNGERVMGDIDRPLRFYKQNDCGNSMMASVPPKDPNPNYVPYGIRTAQAAQPQLAAQPPNAAAQVALAPAQVASAPAQTAAAAALVRIQNRWKQAEFLNNEQGALASGPIQPAWWSAQWTVEPVAGTPFVRIKNHWKQDQYIHIERGRVESGPIQPGAYSAMWTVEPVPGTAFVRIRNRWKSNEFLHNQNGPLMSGPAEAGWWSAHWSIR